VRAKHNRPNAFVYSSLLSPSLEASEFLRLSKGVRDAIKGLWYLGLLHQSSSCRELGETSDVGTADQSDGASLSEGKVKDT
jgi:hypothetical protein